MHAKVSLRAHCVHARHRACNLSTLDQLRRVFCSFFIPSHADEPIYLKWLKCDALRNLIPCVQFKIREDTLGGVLHLVKLQAKV